MMTPSSSLSLRLTSAAFIPYEKSIVYSNHLRTNLNQEIVESKTIGKCSIMNLFPISASPKIGKYLKC